MFRKFLVLIGFIAAAIIVSVWYPVFNHYYTPRPHVSPTVVEQLKSQPSDAVLDRLAEFYLGTMTIKATVLPGNSPTELLRTAGLFDVSSSLKRFARTRDKELLNEIAATVLAYSRRANRLFVLDGFMWDDHAISNRIFVLAEFWQYYRQDESYDSEVAQEIIEHVARNIEYLKRADHFTYWTNHGIMQSIALLHAANSFPSLPNREHIVELALDRLTAQLVFFVSNNGWIMEHSAGYQEFGVNLLTTLFAELELLGRAVPKSWERKLQNAKKIYELLRRPDGSIPNYGDSDFAVRNPTGGATNCWSGRSGVSVWQEGYLLDRGVGKSANNETCTHAAVVWADFVTGAHKRDNELSVHYWADGVDYVKSSGYWPYSDRRRHAALSWLGSNAPHVQGEAAESTSNARQNGFCNLGELWFLDLEREHEDHSNSVRRQIVGLGIDGLLILDTAVSQRQRSYQSVWRVDPRVHVIGPNGELIQAAMSPLGQEHSITIGGGAEVSIVVNGESSAFPEISDIAASANDYHIYPMPTLVIAADVTEPTLISVENNLGTGNRRHASLTDFISPEQWSIQASRGDMTIDVRRDGRQLLFEELGSGLRRDCAIDVDSGSYQELSNMEQQFLATAEGKRAFKAWIPYRLKVTYVVIAILVAQCSLLVLVVWRKPSLARLYSVSSGIVWLVFAGYVHAIYLVQ